MTDARCLLTAAVFSSLAAGAAAASITVPAALQTAPAQTLALEAHAVGVQIYTCSAKEGAAPAWTLTAPDAILYDAAGAKLGTHYAGPTWEAVDGSKVTGKMKASATPSPDAIAWLLLDVTSGQGSGVFGKVVAIQRLATEGGKAPSDGCAAASLGRDMRVPYKAVYRFYTAQQARAPAAAQR